MGAVRASRVRSSAARAPAAAPHFVPRRVQHLVWGFALVVALALATPSARAGALLVLEFELNDLTLYPKVEQERARVASLRPLLVDALAEEEAHATLALPEEAAIESARGAGYLFDRPKVAARLGRAAGADWVVSGRLHKASHLFVYLKAQLVDAADGRVAADFVVEIKGWGEKLTRRGVETLSSQLVETLDTLERRGGASARRGVGTGTGDAVPADGAGAGGG